MHFRNIWVSSKKIKSDFNILHKVLPILTKHVNNCIVNTNFYIHHGNVYKSRWPRHQTISTDHRHQNAFATHISYTTHSVSLGKNKNKMLPLIATFKPELIPTWALEQQNTTATCRLRVSSHTDDRRLKDRSTIPTPESVSASVDELCRRVINYTPKLPAG